MAGSDAARIKRAAAKYGPTVDAIAKRYTNPVTGQPLSGAALLLKLTEGESRALTGDGRSAVSSAGARKWAQFMPGSRAIAVQRHGVDPWASPEQAVHGAALHLRGLVNGSTGLEGYNPGGGQGYVDYILGQKVGAPARSRTRMRSQPLSAAIDARTTTAHIDPPEPVSAPVASSQRQIRPVSLREPEFAAKPVTPGGYQPVASTGGPPAPEPLPAADEVPAPTLAEVLTAKAATSSSSSRSAPASGVSQRRTPVAAVGKVIGVPHSGTHRLGNWQSDNAVDIGVPNGTLVTALDDGVVESVKGGYAGGQSRFDGFRVTVRFANGNRAFYTHLMSGAVKPGQRVRKGQALGRSGSANGVPHLHFALEQGDPRDVL